MTGTKYLTGTKDKSDHFSQRHLETRTGISYVRVLEVESNSGA